MLSRQLGIKLPSYYAVFIMWVKEISQPPPLADG